MSIFSNIFSSQPAQQVQPAQPAPTQPTPGNITAPSPTNTPASLPGGDPQGIVPTAPLDQYKSLWEDAPNQPTNSPTSYVPALSQEQLNKVMAGVDYSKVISPEILQAVAAGGEGASAALMQAITAASQHTMVQSTLVNNKLTEEAIRKAVEATQSHIPELLRKQTSSAKSAELNPLLNNPAVSPIIEAAQNQFLTKNPKASPAEIATMTNDFVAAMGQHFGPKPVSPTTNPDEQDWSKWLDR